MLEILKHPNKILRQKSKKIDLKNIDHQLIADMTETMFKKDGAGLAAPQIGKNIRLVVLNKENKVLVMINPVITKKSWAKDIEPEGCLSVVDKKGEIYFKNVARHKKIKCTYFDAQGKKHELSAEKMLSRAIQHEIDHLDGILFIDKAND